MKVIPENYLVDKKIFAVKGEGASMSGVLRGYCSGNRYAVIQSDVDSRVIQLSTANWDIYERLEEDKKDEGKKNGK